MASHKVGGEVDAFCTKCKLTLAHTILAMVGSKIARVRCNTCGGDHAYRAAPGATTRTPSAARSSSKAASKAEKIVISFQEQLATRDLNAAPMYSPKDNYAADQLINHPTFGYGIVTAVRNDKVDISFKGQQKTLIHRRGDTVVEKPAFSPPKGRSIRPADKPVSGSADVLPSAEDEAAAEAAQPE